MKIKRIRPYRFAVTVFLAVVMVLGFTVDSTKVFAIPDLQFYGSNDILFYDPDAAACEGGGGGSLRGAAVKEKIWNYLVDKGLSAEQAAGVMGNMDAESGFVVTRRQGSSDLWNSNFNNNAWGLAQWDGGRRYSAPTGGILGKLREKSPDLEKYTASEFGGTDGNEKVPPADLDKILLFELEYLNAESTSRRVTATGYGKAANEWETLKLQKTVDDATVFWHNNFEVSADSASKVLEGRGGRAHKVFDEFSGTTTAGGGSSSSSSSDCGGAAMGDLAQTTLAYAWPTYRGKDTTRKPKDPPKYPVGYVEAVGKAHDEGRYVGDCEGVDCGGFVTLLITDSGFDPNYNFGGKIKDGAGFTGVQRNWAAKNWQTLGNGGSIDVATLQPGDVAISSGHTFAYVGDIPGFESKIASSSRCDRAPMAGKENPTGSDFTWFRKK